jgi:hypothetical protein
LRENARVTVRVLCHAKDLEMRASLVWAVFVACLLGAASGAWAQYAGEPISTEGVQCFTYQGYAYVPLALPLTVQATLMLPALTSIGLTLGWRPASGVYLSHHVSPPRPSGAVRFDGAVGTPLQAGLCE